MISPKDIEFLTNLSNNPNFLLSKSIYQEIINNPNSILEVSDIKPDIIYNIRSSGKILPLSINHLFSNYYTGRLYQSGRLYQYCTCLKDNNLYVTMHNYFIRDNIYLLDPNTLPPDFILNELKNFKIDYPTIIKNYLMLQ